MTQTSYKSSNEKVKVFFLYIFKFFMYVVERVWDPLITAHVSRSCGRVRLCNIEKYFIAFSYFAAILLA